MATAQALQRASVGIFKHGMLDQNKAVIGDPVPQILRQWLQAWRRCFTAPSWEHVLVLVMGGLLATGKRTVTSCLRVTGRADASNFATYHQILNRARWSSRAVARRLLGIVVERLPSPTAATIAVAVIGPTPGAVARRWLSGLDLCQVTIRFSISPSLSVSVSMCRKRHRNASRASSGTTVLSEVARRSLNIASCRTPLPAISPYSPSSPRSALIVAVRCRTNRLRTRCKARTVCCCFVLIGTNRMFGLATASHMASASAASVLFRFTNHEVPIMRRNAA